VHSALTFLTVCSIRNNIRTRLRRLRQPRYLLAAIGVVLYFGTMVFNRSHSGAFRIPPRYDDVARVATGVLVAGVMAVAWLLPIGASARFTLADVHFLFAAPLTRRQLLEYRMARLLIGAAGTGLFFTLIVGPLRPGAALVFYLKATLILSLLGVHEAGVSLFRQNRADTDGLSGRRAFPVLATAVLLTAFSSVALARFAFAAVPGEFLSLLPVVLMAIVGEAVWVVRSDAAFEEQAVVQAEKLNAQRAGMRKPQPRLAATGRSTSVSLAPRGPVETAILWKNWLLLTRGSGMQRAGGAAVVLLFVVGLLAAFGTAKGDSVAPVLGFVVAGMVVLLGPVMLRIDLRQDLANLPLIKTWPASGASIIRGEVLAPAIALSAAAFAAIAIGASFAPESMRLSSTVAGRPLFIVVATVVASALIVTQLVIQNGIAALFPAWIRVAPGAAGAGGVEIMGQSLIVMYGGLLALMGAAIVPGAAAATVAFTAGGTSMPAAVFAVLLLVECYGATEILGRIVDRTDLQDVMVAE